MSSDTQMANTWQRQRERIAELEAENERLRDRLAEALRMDRVEFDEAEDLASAPTSSVETRRDAG